MAAETLLGTRSQTPERNRSKLFLFMIHVFVETWLNEVRRRASLS